jgi:hypothetical protein
MDEALGYIRMQSQTLMETLSTLQLPYYSSSKSLFAINNDIP